jgi:hypothetical protein
MQTFSKGAATLAAAAAMVAIAAPAASAQPYFGFNDNAVAMGQVNAATSADLAHDAGATSSRTVFNWRDTEREPGVLRLDGYDKIYSESLARGIRPIFTLAFAPRWAWAAGVNCAEGADCRYPPAPERDSAWRRIVTTIVNRYPDLAALEIWNEPNLSKFWHGGVDPVRYTSLLTQAYSAAKEAGSPIPVLGGSLAPNFEYSPTLGMAYRTFLTKMYASGAKGSMDGLAVHPYPADIDFWLSYKVLTETREVRDDAGDSATPLWLTEFGVSTSDYQSQNYVFDPPTQGTMLVALINRFSSMSDVRGMFVHTLVTPTYADPGSTERGYGVVGAEPTLIPKPAYCALADANNTAYACPVGIAKSRPVADIQLQRWRAQDLLQSAADAARAYRASNGSYVGLTADYLHSADSDLSATPAVATDQPGPNADPSRVGVLVRKAASGDFNVVLCNASQADRSYCIYTTPGQGWTYGKAEGSVSTAASAVTQGRSWWW